MGLFDRFKKRISGAERTRGVSGAELYGGYLHHPEIDSDISTPEKRYKTYSDILANIAIVAAGVRYYLNLVGNARWSFEPSSADRGGQYAEYAEQILTVDPRTSWERVVRRIAMFRFYGFSIQEWTAIRRADGILTYSDISPRPQKTIERWNIRDDGYVNGAFQRSPQTQQEIYLPREKIVYAVDDSLDDGPEGLGVFRHLVKPAARLARYQILEGFGFETDLRGIPYAKIPYSALNDAVNRGEITKEEREEILKPTRDFVKNHIKNPQLGMIHDSLTWQTEDDARRPSAIPQWDLKLLTGGATAFQENALAITRLTRELAIILGVDQLLLGTNVGSFALSKDKTNNFFLQVDSSLKEIKNTFNSDLLERAWELNGWSPDLMPEMNIDAVRFADIQTVSAALRDIATAGGAPISTQ